MSKLIVLLMSSFWLSCGNQNENSKKVPTVVKEKTELSVQNYEQIIAADTIRDTEITTTEIKEVATIKNEQVEATDTIAVSTNTSQEVKTKSIDTARASQEEIAETTIQETPSWNSLLQKYVNDAGDVDYKGFLTDIDQLEAYLDAMAENSPKSTWSKEEKLAYYINLYNAATVKLILDNYPVKSIKDINKPWGKAWVKIGESKLSLGNIEHKILRKMNEPRIHFAINCASYSCPKLLNKAFTASQMEIQLEQATRDFINDKTRNSISEEKMQLSNIFKWYKKDFTENGSLADYIKLYTKVNINSDTNIDYLKYDWNLNEAK